MENNVSDRPVYFESRMALDEATHYDLYLDLNSHHFVLERLVQRGLFILFAVVFLLFFWRQPALVPYAFIFPVSYIISDTNANVRLKRRAGGRYARQVISNAGISPINVEIVFSDKIYFKRDNYIRAVEFPYEYVLSLWEHKLHYVLALKDSSLIILKKEDVSGRDATFPEFIFNKCPQTRRWSILDIRRGRRQRTVFLAVQYAVVAALAVGWAAAYLFLG